MAEENIEEAVVEEEVKSQNSAMQDDEDDSAKLNFYYFDKNRTYGMSFADTKDLVENRYKIHVNEKIESLDSHFAKAYKVTDLHNKKAKELYALVLDKRHPVRLMEINKLSNNHNTNLSNVVSFQKIPLSLGKGQFVVVILERPQGVTLTEFINENGAFPEPVLFEQILPQLASALAHTSSLGITHGIVHPDHIFVSEEGVIVLGECISEICGFSQAVLYETLDRAVTLPMGKGISSPVVDYFALGVLAAILLRGRNPWAHLSDNDLLGYKFQEGTYKIVSQGLELTGHFDDFLRGTLSDKDSDIWKDDQINQWLKGRRYNLLPPTSHAEATRPISFAGKKYMSRKHLVYAFYNNWEKAKEFIKSDTLIRWVERSVQNSELADRIDNAASLIVGLESDVGLTREDEYLIHVMMLLDPMGPIKLFGTFAANMDGISTTFAYAFSNDKAEYLQNIVALITHDFISLWNVGFAGTFRTEYQQEVFFALQRCKELLKRKENGFGMNRVLYEINPTLSCQSPKIVENSVFNIRELLVCLDADESISGNMLDDHMWTFLSNRLELPRAIRINSLQRFPDYQNHVHIQTLGILSHCQSTSSTTGLGKLTIKMREALGQVVDDFHSKQIREDVTAKLDKVVKHESLSILLKVMTDQKYVVRDTLGFLKARKRYKSNALQIIKLNNKEAIHNVGYRYGLQFSVMLSFLVASIVIVVLIVKYI